MVIYLSLDSQKHSLCDNALLGSIKLEKQLVKEKGRETGGEKRQKIRAYF